MVTNRQSFEWDCQQTTELDVSLDYMIDVFAEVENVNTSNFVSFPKLDHYVLIKGVKNILDDIQTDVFDFKINTTFCVGWNMHSKSKWI